MKKLPSKKGVVIAPRGSLEMSLLTDSRGTVIIGIEREYELITPLFGGGVEPGVNDAISPISGKSIRGHLRFWWRATRAGQFGGGNQGLRRMKEREALIWGAASTPAEPRPSNVQLQVLLGPYAKFGNEEKPYSQRHVVDPDWKNRAYAAFPFQDDPHSVSKYRFTLKVSFPEVLALSDHQSVSLRAEVSAALWAWETFGGIGARTRRGFGALRTKHSLPKEPKNIEEKIRDGLKEFVLEGEYPPGVPHLSQDMSFVLATSEKMIQVGRERIKTKVAYSSSDEAWEALIVKLKNFRQARSGATGFGRSKWNEPERIREITRQRWTSHTKNVDLASIESFPRAAFGQPILFQFHRNQKNSTPPYSSNRDPVDTTLKGGQILNTNKYRERLASPLILRPIACGGTKAVGLAAILRTQRVAPEGLVLQGDAVSTKIDLTITKKDALKIEPLRDFAFKLANENDEVDVLEAFLDCFRTEEKKK